jgi:hypothetical protein
MTQIRVKKYSFPFVIAVFALLVLGIIILASAQDNRDPMETIRAFIGNPTLELKEVPGTDATRGSQTRTYTTLDSSFIFTVDVPRRMVVYALFTNTQSGGGSEIGHDEALQAAQAFATSRVTDFQQMSLSNETSEDHGAAGTLYHFVWADRLGSQQAIGLKRVAITVDAGSGAIQSFSQTPSDGIEVNVEPTVSRDQALAIAQKQFGEATISQNVKLDVWWRNNDRIQPQVLRWTVTLDSHVPLNANAEPDQQIFKHAKYIIDAHTGDILEELH